MMTNLGWPKVCPTGWSPAKSHRCLRHKNSAGVWKFSRYFDPSGQEAEQYEMYHLAAADGGELDIEEEFNIANPLVAGYDPVKKIIEAALGPGRSGTAQAAHLHLSTRFETVAARSAFKQLTAALFGEASAR